jgi:hypothetical protein
VLFTGDAPAQAPPKIHSLYKVGDATGDVSIGRRTVLRMIGYTERSGLIFIHREHSGVLGDFVFRVADGKNTPLLVPGREGPAGTWPSKVYLQMTTINRRGIVAVDAIDYTLGWLGVFRWDPDTEKFAFIAQKNTPASEGFTVVERGFGLALNSLDETALALQVKDATGKEGHGIFLIGRDGRWQPVLRPGQELPGGGTVLDEPGHNLTLNDAGRILFQARRQGDEQYSLYSWEQGTLSPVLLVGAAAPGGKKITAVSSAMLNDANRDVILSAAVEPNAPRARFNHNLYRLRDGQLTAIAERGQPMPGGGVFRTVRSAWIGFGTLLLANGVGGPNSRGEFAFLATLEDGAAAIYRVDAAGQLVLVARSGQETEWGKITALGQVAEGDNVAPLVTESGEIITFLRLNAGPEMIALLTPTLQ